MRKVLIALLVVVFACSSVFAASKAKKADDPHKEQLSAGFDVINRAVDVRLWASDGLGIEINAGLDFNSDDTELGLNVGAGVLLPLAEGEVNFYLVPEIGLSSRGYKIGDDDNYVAYSNIGLSAGAMLKIEVFLPAISKDLSIGSGVGAGLIINLLSSKTTVGGTTTQNPSSTEVSFGIVNGWVQPLVIRYYF